MPRANTASRKQRSALLRAALERARKLPLPIAHLDAAAVLPNPFLPFHPPHLPTLRRLVASIKQGAHPGLVEPAIVWRLPGRPPRWILLDHSLAWHAARAAGLPAVPARILPLANQDTAERFALAAAIRHGSLSASEEAAAYRRLLHLGLSRDDAAALTGFGRGHLTYALQLLDLPAGVTRLIDLGALTHKHARFLHRFVHYPRTLTLLAAHAVLNRWTAQDLAPLRPDDPASLHAAGLVQSGADSPETALADLERLWRQKRAVAALAGEIDSWTDAGALTPETAAAVATTLVLQAGPAPTVAAITRQLPQHAAVAAALAGSLPAGQPPTAATWSLFLLELARENPLLALKVAFEAHRLHALTSPPH